MPASLLLLLFAPLLAAASEPHNSPPFYATDSITNSADYLTALAPNAIGTIFGTGLSYTTASLSAQDIVGGVMPYGLPGSGVNVLIGGLAANLFYVSPTQINFLVPSILIPGPTHIQVVLNGIAGPSVPFTLTATSPALYQLDPKTVIATRLDGSLITAAAPAQPGEILTLWATGLGDTIPPVIYSNVAATAATLQLILRVQGAAQWHASRFQPHPLCGRRTRIRGPVPDQCAASPRRSVPTPIFRSVSATR